MAQRHKLPGEHIYEGMVLPGNVRADIMDRLKNFSLDQDLLIASYPKTGTTWVQELVWLIMKEGDTKEATSVPLHIRIKYIEMVNSALNTPYMDELDKEPHPRIMKTHVPLKYFKKYLAKVNTKWVVPLRNPKDALVSSYHFYQMNGVLGNFAGTWDDFFALYKDRHLIYGDMIDWYVDCWSYRENSNVFLVKYEDLKRDLRGEVCKMAAFLDKSLTGDVIDAITSHGTFDSMRQNKMTNYTGIPIMDSQKSPFMRKGTVGDWKNYFTREQSEFIDEQVKAHLEPIGLSFEYDIVE